MRYKRIASILIGTKDCLKQTLCIDIYYNLVISWFSFSYFSEIILLFVIYADGWTTLVKGGKKKGGKKTETVEEKLTAEKIVEKVKEVTAAVVSEEPPQEQRNKKKQKKKAGKVKFVTIQTYKKNHIRTQNSFKNKRFKGKRNDNTYMTYLKYLFGIR